MAGLVAAMNKAFQLIRGARRNAGHDDSAD